MKILFFGDIVGKIGRRGIKALLPELKKKYQPDLIVANAENLAHGSGITPSTLEEMRQAGIDFFTSGNHILRKPEVETLLRQKNMPLIRPANYPPETPGLGSKTIEVGSRKVLIINLMGQVFMKEQLDNPFRTIDKILNENKPDDLAAIIVDFHAEATSEKVAFGWYVDGRVSAVVGTHTHVPTADAKILPQGTAYISDIGMVGAADSVIGVKKEPVIKQFLGAETEPFGIPENGPVTLNAVLLEIDPQTKKAVRIERLDRTLEL